ncbi:class I adenylate-forming enzyme family protein [Streptomyces canus]|uniref:class I adenylate-forming enzyme family protein n=1 Tax=Streptomyces canus TaxID=58343 RepID=UPI0022550E72|nr:class I adenylate-forming enzyme family protein [Streptomyces canus]MCX4856333.1 acyl--CoA ligase [Streptomyces canus]
MAEPEPVRPDIAPGFVPLDVSGLPHTLDGLLSRAAAARPGHRAVVTAERAMTFAELDTSASTLAGVLCARLTGRRQVVAVAAALDPDFAVAYFAVARGGHVAAVVNPLLREDDLAHVLNLSGARAAFVDAGLYPRLAAVRDRLPELEHVFLLGPDGQPTGAAESFPEHLAELLAAAPPGPAAPAAEPAPDDTACLHFTSGTTGRPKGVRLSHRNLVVNARQIAVAHALDGTSVTVNHLPTYHPMHLNSAIHALATQVLCTTPDPTASVLAANQYRATHLYSLPFRLARLARDERLPGLRLDTVAHIASGGSALAPDYATRLSEHFGVHVFQGYGLAETSPLTHSDDPHEPVPGSVGRPVAGTECRVVDVDRRRGLQAGETGEVQVRGPQVMRGYLGAPEGSGVAPDGWFSTGDVGRIGPDGRLFLVDRLKDVFKYHNWLVSPSETERVLRQHPLVADCVVFDHPENDAGAVAHALLVLRPGAGAGGSAGPEDVAEVCRLANSRLPYFQQVRYAEAVSSIPRSPNGKVRRRELRDRYLGAPGDTVEVPGAPTVPR